MKQLNINRQNLLALITPVALLAILAVVMLLAAELFDMEFVEDWFAREGGAIASWWLIATLAGLATFPILYRLVPGLPSRGYALARTAGLMLTGFIFWAGASLGFVANAPGAAILAWVLVIVIAAMLWRRRELDTLPIGQWLRQHALFIFVVEVMFVALLVGWATVRAHEPEISTTEKPMEIMFVNSIRQSETFPPNDGWMAGYSISYYYFGYVITAVMADLADINTGIAFGLIGPMLFALAGIGALGIGYDLVRARDKLGRWQAGGANAGIWTGMLAMLLLIFAGSLGPLFIEMPWNGLASGVASNEYFEFWGAPERSNIVEPTEDQNTFFWPKENSFITRAQLESGGYVLERDLDRDNTPDWAQSDMERDLDQWDRWWWFRYSRIIQDRFLDDRPLGIQPIAEVPHFSFILSDIHPHVLSLPFTLLAIGLAAGLVLNGKPLEWWGFILFGIWVGGLIFLNSWDAVFIPFVVGAEALRRLIRHGTGHLTRDDWLQVGVFGAILLGLTLVFYLMWIISFNSQASGFYFNIIWPTASQQLFLQFGGFFLIFIPFLIREAMLGWRHVAWQRVLLVWAVLAIFLTILPFVAAFFYDAACGDGFVTDPESLKGTACNARGILFGGTHPEINPDFWQQLANRRLSAAISEGAILFALVFITFRLFAKDSGERRIVTYSPATGFALLTMAAGLVLVFTPDFIYLNDNFNVRINTVFKFYYQAWILFSVSAAFAAYALLTDAGKLLDMVQERKPTSIIGQGAFAVLLVAILLTTMIYPVLAIQSRSMVETGRMRTQEARDLCLENAESDSERAECPALPSLTLDGRARSIAATEYEIVECLQRLDPGGETIIAEAPLSGGYWVSGTYSRISTLTGIPTVLGWTGHQQQWRGVSYAEVTEEAFSLAEYEFEFFNAAGQRVDFINSREGLLDLLYQVNDLTVAQDIIDHYDIDYIMLGSTELSRYREYPDGLNKFENWLPVACPQDDGGAVLYATR